MKKLAILTILLLAIPSMAQARRYTIINEDGKEIVLHTNAGPVIVHRILPPYGIGKHVYAGKDAARIAAEAGQRRSEVTIQSPSPSPQPVR